MKTVLMTLASLVAAAALESGGDAAIRHGLSGRATTWLALGASVLVLYGFVVNIDRLLDFSTLMGGYIVVFFVVSQLIAVFLMHDRLAPTTLLGGALIVLGGVIVQWGALKAGRSS